MRRKSVVPTYAVTWWSQPLTHELPLVLRLITIGEAVKQIPADITAATRKIGWRKIAGLRDISVHLYHSIKPIILWNIIQTGLDPLEDTVAAMIQEME